MTISNKTINFDMDGTIAGLYDVDGWLEDLNKENARPFRKAQPLVDMRQLARQIHRLQKIGYEVNIISWLPKGGSPQYSNKVAETKRKWLKQHLGSVAFDNVTIVPYGTPKYTCGSGILFDDEVENRKLWRQHCDKAFTPNDINQTLKKFR